ncbi:MULTISPECIES: sensor histidine kinase [Streptococcus]|uniref:histidine kinase n=1 Tax=Streptococcus pseudoporcinus LQ 940-04 TaxID=875093 RepID=G5K9A8_9STRE|nr:MULTISPECIES: HAMP domain-containing sensor histidine kinase [Streptococcus]VPI43109.1 two-component system histidine kinase [Streptococcus pneumoniae]HEQ1217720.1 HAMP domain-containing histidine kinase [Streptococcus pyogenes]EHI64352.1 ATPase/histidine kinase/DNA gyrase B/HSP90 domain protein [Streptococcus pseudoporcinus LQ 940-04]CNI95104.1 two-component system histidine kinase [Streptococcus agalactiae]VEF93286.1 two-component system histidine kinase [Streptococcus pseudoporcinus]
MNKSKNILLALILNVVMSLFVIYLNPRFDILTLIGFLLINIILFIVISKIEKKKEKALEDKINNIFKLLHSLDIDSDNYEIIDDEFGKLRDEIIKIIIENKRIAENAEKNKETLREYTEDIAHQIKTPLTGSLLLLDLLEDEIDNVSEEYIERLRDNLLRLHNLSDILLKLAALDSGTIEMAKDRISARELIEDIIRNLQDYFINDNIEISLDGEDFYLICDKKWTYEALFNVMKNGIEATEGRHIEIHLKETNLYKSIFVEDFSKGLDREMLEKVFKRFYKLDPNSKGYGIGLPMAKSVMERQNGELLYHKGKKSNTFEMRFYN